MLIYGGVGDCAEATTKIAKKDFKDFAFSDFPSHLLLIRLKLKRIPVKG